MEIPELNDAGDLPVGIHGATLKEALHRFAESNARRRLLGTRLERVFEVAAATGHVARFIVFGSFITGKPAPNDVDVFMLMDDDFDVSVVSGETAILFDHTRAQSHFGCSVFWLRRLAALGGEEQSIVQWQIKRDGGERGLVEILPEATDDDSQ